MFIEYVDRVGGEGVLEHPYNPSPCIESHVDSTTVRVGKLESIHRISVFVNALCIWSVQGHRPIETPDSMIQVFKKYRYK